MTVTPDAIRRAHRKPIELAPMPESRAEWRELARRIAAWRESHERTLRELEKAGLR